MFKRKMNCTTLDMHMDTWKKENESIDLICYFDESNQISYKNLIHLYSQFFSLLLFYTYYWIKIRISYVCQRSSIDGAKYVIMKQ